MKTDDPVFKRFLDAAELRVIIQADVPNFTIVAYNDAYKHATYTRYRDVIGWYLWEAFDPARAGSDGYELLLKTLTDAVEKNEFATTHPFRYDIQSEDPGEIIERWWQVEIRPFVGDTGIPAFLFLKTIPIAEE